MRQNQYNTFKAAHIQRLSGTACQEAIDNIVIEEPLEIRLNGQSLAVTMRTPGQDQALAVGFLLTEGIIASKSDVWDIQHCAGPETSDQLNIVEVTVAPELIPNELQSGRQRYANSSCGICGKATIEAIRLTVPPIASPPSLDIGLLYSLPDRMRQRQQVFEHTGGLHASGIFDLGGQLLFLAEDIGRHNAVDKVIGMALLADRDISASVLMVSGRAGFEIVQKALAARIPAVCSVSAPSSLAVDLAIESGMILVGFLRGETMNVYSGKGQVLSK